MTPKSSKSLLGWLDLQSRNTVARFWLEDHPLTDMIVMMIELESKQAAETFYFSKEYEAAKAVRHTCSDTYLMIIEGADYASD
jgi:uncharacterized protein (DUF1330 family)